MKANFLPQLLVYRVHPHLDHLTQATLAALLIGLSLTTSVFAVTPMQHVTQQPTSYAKIVSRFETHKFKTINHRYALGSSIAKTKLDKTDMSKGLALIKECESGGNYQAVNPAGYYGAYQFSASTWNSTAQAANRHDLVGVRPDRASSADQDAMAKQLHSVRGWQPWGCAHHVGLL